jgi:hypothetical protein
MGEWAVIKDEWAEIKDEWPAGSMDEWDGTVDE